MTGSYFGLIGAFIGVLAVPDRRIPQLTNHELPLLALLVIVLLGTAALTVAGIPRRAGRGGTDHLAAPLTHVVIDCRPEG